MMKVLLVCSAGMSSAIAAKSLQEAAEKEGMEMEVNEASTSHFEDLIGKGYDLALVAPQIRHRFKTLAPIAEKHHVPILQIKPKGYSGIGGKFLLAQIKEEASQVFE